MRILSSVLYVYSTLSLSGFALRAISETADDIIPFISLTIIFKFLSIVILVGIN